MSVLVDTDICSAYLRGNGAIVTRMQQLSGRIHLSAITLGELFVWALRRNAPRRYLAGINAFLEDVTVLPADGAVARAVGEVRSQLLDRGQAAPLADLWIAATALTHDLTVITHNTSDFQHVPGLSVDDCLKP